MRPDDVPERVLSERECEEMRQPERRWLAAQRGGISARRSEKWVLGGDGDEGGYEADVQVPFMGDMPRRGGGR